MELIWDRAIEDWGDCKGRAWCGSCQIELVDGANQLDKMANEEHNCLCKQEYRTNNSRLACQLMIDEKLDGIKVQFLGDT